MGTYKWSFPSGMVSQINSGKIKLTPTYSSPYETDGAFDVKVVNGATAAVYTITCTTESCETTGKLTIKDCSGGGGDTCDLTISVKSGDPTAQAGGEVQFQHSQIPITCEITEVGQFGTSNVGAKIGTLPNDLAGCNWSFAGGGDWVTDIGVPLDKPTEIWASIASNGGTNTQPRQTTITATCLSGEYCRGCNEMSFNVRQAGTSAGGGPTIKFTLNKVSQNTTIEDYSFIASDLNIGGKDGYKVHNHDDGTLDIVPTNICIIAQYLGVGSVTNNCSDLKLDCGYYTYNTNWPFSTDANKKEAFRRAWECTSGNTNWQATAHTTCDGLDFRNNKVTLILDNNTDYYIPYDGHFKLQVGSSGVKIYYRNCSDRDTTQYKSPHYHYGRYGDTNQCSNYILAPHSQVTLNCAAEQSLDGITSSQISNPELYLCNLTNKIDKSQGSTHTNYADFFLHRGYLGGNQGNITVTLV